MEPKLLKQIEASSGDINYCTFSPSGSTVASAGGEGLVRLWSASDGAELACSPLRGHSERFYVNVCEFSPDGSLLATAGSDSSVKLWDANTWGEIGEEASSSESGRCSCVLVGTRVLYLWFTRPVVVVCPCTMGARACVCMSQLQWKTC